jgi:SAM-dependent methyltransferase
MTDPTTMQPPAPANAGQAPAAQGDLAEFVRPRWPHDGLSFDELARSYNFANTSDDRMLLTRMILGELAPGGRAKPAPTRVVDVGCGKGIGLENGYQKVIAGACTELWGLEPDTGITPEPGIFSNFQYALMETAKLPENSFDAAYSFMVMEHVADPAGFLRAVHRCLKPGGAYYFVTVNRRHYFTLLASAMRSMRIDEAMLRVLRGRQSVEGYHYPTVYKCNMPSQIDALAKETGFAPPEYVFTETEGPAPYLPGPLKPILWTMQAKRRMLKNPGVLLRLIARLRKPM